MIQEELARNLLRHRLPFKRFRGLWRRKCLAGQSTEVGPPRPNIQPPPPAVFEPGRHLFFLSPTGERYHMSRQCRGLRKASRILECGRCTGCLPIEPRWEPGDRVLYSVGPGRPIHGNNTHRITEMPEEEHRAYRPCHICVILRER